MYGYYSRAGYSGARMVFNHKCKDVLQFGNVKIFAIVGANSIKTALRTGNWSFSKLKVCKLVSIDLLSQIAKFFFNISDSKTF